VYIDAKEITQMAVASARVRVKNKDLWGQFFKRIFAPMRQARAYATVAFGWVGTYTRIDAYASFKTLASGKYNYVGTCHVPSVCWEAVLEKGGFEGHETLEQRSRPQT
jgi:hypothetical protein